MSEYFVVGSNVGGLRLESDPIRKEAGPTYSWIRPRAATSHRTVFITVLPGRWSLFNPSHKGTPMFSTQADIGPFPGIKTTHDIRGNRRWVLGVFQGNPSSPSWSDFTDAQYFQCKGERRNILHEEIEAWQPVGKTDLSDYTIRNFESQLWHDWRPPNYDWRLWNSQNFILYLAFLVIRQGSQETDLLTLRSLHINLWLKQAGRSNNMMIRRHLTGMFGMVALGVATGGVGAFASWAFCGYNMFEGDSAFRNRAARLQILVGRFPELVSLLQADDTGAGSDEHEG
ncbi:hypothetical protein K469DRAFT_705741 [Zopfia rhizophila CBS 207.26]|uniref:Uncharacterized protein n=1 Tax=Zopfia rhizophila CBS 207.26 TaxID=1314779 RepID=A0A6A6EAM3_9PEZI|nr:hypothetical protein K469DRAFT_705741 [Zopfia rhizophila CBS 207.26]